MDYSMEYSMDIRTGPVTEKIYFTPSLSAKATPPKGRAKHRAEDQNR